MYHTCPFFFNFCLFKFYNSGNNKTVLQNLEEQLLNKGYNLNKRDSKETYYRLRDTSHDSYFASFVNKLVIPFISLFKRQNFCKDDFSILINKAPTNIVKQQLMILNLIYTYYQNKLIELNKIDFEDMINEAYKIMPTIKESDLNVDYNYIIIDEYQDISIQRYNLTKSISDLFSAKIMAVGDDWQSIFGFSGAQIDLFTNFKDYLEGAKAIPIVNTYRIHKN